MLRCCFITLLLYSVLVGARVAIAAEPVSSASASAAAIGQKNAEVARLLQDPQTRAVVVQQLAASTPPAAAPPSPVTAPQAAVKAQTAAALENISKSITSIHFGVSQLIIEYQRITDLLSGVGTQFKDSHQRWVWISGFLKCWLVIALGYLVFFLSHHSVQAFIRRFLPLGQRRFMKVLRALTVWLLNLLPLAVFAIGSYFSLIFLRVDINVQWALLAWISAFLIVHILTAIFDFVFALLILFPRIFSLNVQSANFFKKWLRWLTEIIVYGYFILQVAVFLGASPDVYDVLIKLLGLLVVLTLIAFVLRSPLRMIKLLASRRYRRRGGDKALFLERWARIQNFCRTGAIVYILLLYLVWIAQSDHFFWFVLKGTLLSVVVMVLAYKLILFIHRYLSREVKINPVFRKRLPGLEQRLRRYRRGIDIILQTFIYFLVLVFLFKIWRGPEAVWLPDTVKEMFLIKIISIVCILLAAVLVWEISNTIIEISLTKGGEDPGLESGRTHTLFTMARRTILVALSIIVLLMILAELGLNVGPLLAGAGVLGLAISFGAQKLMQDLITGFFMLLENQVAVGDWVKIGDNSGTVEAISIRVLRLRDSAGVVNIIPYSSIVTVSNYTRDFSYSVFEVNVAYRENTDEVVEVLREIGENLRKDPLFSLWILEPLEVLGLDRFVDSAVVLRVRLKTKPGMQWQVSREFNRRMKQKFDELDIEMPVPHRTIYFGIDKQGTAPPLRAQIEKNN